MDERLLSGTEETEGHESAPPPDRREAIRDRIKTSLKDLLQRCQVGGAEKILHSIQEIDVSGDDSVEELCQLTIKIVRCIPKPDREILFKNGLSKTLVEIIKELYPEFFVSPVHDIGIVIYAVSESNIPSPVVILFFLEPETGHSHPPNHIVMKIDDNGVLNENNREATEFNRFLNVFWDTLFQSHSTYEHHLTAWATLCGILAAQLSVLGNPLDKLSESRDTDPVELSIVKACAITVWVSMFFLNFILVAMRTFPLPHRIPAYSVLGLSLLYYILAIIAAMSGSSVSLSGSVKISGLLFVFGGATCLMLLLSIIIIGVIYAAWCSSPDLNVPVILDAATSQ